MSKKILATLICVIIILSQISAMAAGFPDVDSTKYSWAYSQINEMSNMKIINGFPDGTFGPEQAVTRIDALLLISRILGASDEDEASFLDSSLDTYFADVNVMNYPDYQKNLAYLIYRGLFTPSELRSFLTGNLGRQALARHEAAILLVKTMGAEAEVKANTMPVLSYSDSSTVPAASKAYVEYCFNKGLMKGMEDNKFNPLENVTRAQMAVMLYSSMNKLNFTASRGTVYEVSAFTDSIKYTDQTGAIRTINVVDSIPVKFNGSNLESLEKVMQGDEINVIYSNNNITFIEILTVFKDDVVEGIFAGNTITSVTAKISIRPIVSSDSSIKDYILSDGCVVLLNGEATTVDKITKGDHVKVTIKDSKAILVDAQKKDKQISGYISEFVYETPSKMKVKLADNTIATYDLASTVNVTRNGQASDVSSLMVGDKVTIALEYDLIRTIEATSTSKTIEGTIDEIVISSNPTIKITTDKETIECALIPSLVVTVNGTASDVYGLKLGYKAKVTMESATISKIEVNSTPTVDTLNVVGTVLHVDTNYMFISIQTPTGDTEQIFVKKNATILDSTTQKTRALSSIKAGSSITAVITSNGFVPEAISIVILSEPK